MNKKELYLAIRNRLEEGSFLLTEVLENNKAFYSGQILPLEEDTENFTLYAPRKVGVALTSECFVHMYMVISIPHYHEENDELNAEEETITLYTGYIKSIDFLEAILDSTGLERAVRTKDKYYYKNIWMALNKDVTDIFNPILWDEFVLEFSKQKRDFLVSTIKNYMRQIEFDEESINSVDKIACEFGEFALQAMLYGLAEQLGLEECEELKFTLDHMNNNWL